ncbi:hypothetical protein ILUMI_06505 [Ignelater luminosus]|uniref:Reverse transcriptase domain-containing protein n=1 Tax=Ignelater luminosus TaxID=2038154 RepID=A0A8K0GCI3_IGNLU|nr:hypothetical protein ILUMI_06505 [Ignelater luminosus]
MGREKKVSYPFQLISMDLLELLSRTRPFLVNLKVSKVQQKLMDSILGPKLEAGLFVYFDGVIITSSSFEEHVAVLKEVTAHLVEVNLTINLKKCKFFCLTLKYLAFVGLRTHPEKVEAMVNFPRSPSTADMKRFIGACGWYRS